MIKIFTIWDVDFKQVNRDDIINKPKLINFCTVREFKTTVGELGRSGGTTPIYFYINKNEKK